MGVPFFRQFQRAPAPVPIFAKNYHLRGKADTVDVVRVRPRRSRRKIDVTWCFNRRSVANGLSAKGPIADIVGDTVDDRKFDNRCAGYAAATGLLSRVIASCNFCGESKSNFLVMH